MEAVNFTKHILQKGLNTNIDNIRYPADSAFEILNGRIYSSDGKNFVVKNVDGNQFKFALKSGYTLIGAQEYDEILYLVSVNDDNMLEVPLDFADEKRFLCIGMIGEKHYSAIITYRHLHIRIISVRRARKEEIFHYENCTTI